MFYIKISKLRFYVILILILLFPLAKKYKLLIFGERTKAEAVYNGQEFVNTAEYSYHYFYTEFEFKVNDRLIRIQGSENVIYDIGEQVTILFDNDNPNNCMILSFTSLYSTVNAIISSVLALIWLAFYSTFNQKERKNH